MSNPELIRSLIVDAEQEAARQMRERAAKIIRALNIGLKARQIEIIERRIRALPIDAAQESSDDG